jgi:serralysin
MSLVGLSGNSDIDGILWGVKWDGPAITYGFPTQASQYVGYSEIDGLQAFNAAQKAAVDKIIGELNGIVTLSVTLASDPATANLRFAEADYVDQDGFGSPGFIDTAVGSPPDDTFIPPYGQGDMFYNRSDFNDPVKGAYDYITLIHELGHSLGLKHGHAPQISPDGNFTFPRLPRQHDSMEFSVMTYRSNVGGSVEGAFTNEEFGFAQSWMMNDIAALQYLYGADFTANAGDTVYSWDALTGEMFIDGAGQGQPGANRVFLTIWDGNGVDTYDMSNYTSSVTINLTPGRSSITSVEQLAVLDVTADITARGNVFNALLYQDDIRSLIENAEGGTRADSISGNKAANTLSGNRGADVITGLGNSDTLIGGQGDDTLRGGNGADVLIGSTGRDILTGGKGDDAFLYENKRHGLDTVRDFSSSADGNDDRFEFASVAFGGLAVGAIAAELFQTSDADAAQTEDVRFFFETDTGILRFDQDGSGTAYAAVVIATIQAGGTVTTDDILIV